MSHECFKGCDGHDEPKANSGTQEFSDEDMKRVRDSLKFLTDLKVEGSSSAECMSLTLREWVAFLARLEAAEAVCREIDEHFLSDQKCVEGLLHTWLKSKGARDA